MKYAFVLAVALGLAAVSADRAQAQTAPLPVFTLGGLPAGAVVVGTLVVVAGVVVGVLASSGATTGTN